MMHEEGGMADPEEIQAMLKRARGVKSRTPPDFAKLVLPAKMLFMQGPNNGVKF